MQPRAIELIRCLELQPHPEGGFYRRIYRSSSPVERREDGAERCALTSIFYLLQEGARSRWHRVVSDEAWHHYEGAPLELLHFQAEDRGVGSHRLGPVGEGGLPVFVIPAGWWQAARSLGAYSLVGCTVAPGFEFEDFTLLADLPEAQRPIPQDFPDFTKFL
ncbi:MAG: cupin domain-containing protein [Methylococcaceae bacterium]|nr:cupin domain-containing protein [Methylococcaceae bacterium]